MAYRFGAGLSRDLDLAHVTTPSDFQLHMDGGFHYAALSPVIRPTTTTFATHDFGRGAFTASSSHIHSFNADATTSGSPTDLDTVPGDNTSTVTLNVMEGQTIEGTINTVGIGGAPPAPGTDADWYLVHLEAGNSYKFNMAQADQSSTGPDFRLTLYDADGNIVGPTSDSGGMGEPEELRYSATSSGAYYISVDNFTPVDFGDYTITGHIDSSGGGTGGTPLASIDWGGPDNKMTDGVDDGVTHIKVYYALAGEVWGSADDPIVSVGWDDFAKDATFVAMDQYEHIINVEYEETADSSEADWILVQTVTAPALLGQMRPPGTENEGQGDFNKAGFDYDEASCQQGGFSYITFIHEFGHGMGLAHPHDTGGGSEVMHGVDEGTTGTATGYSTGDFGLNQGIFTTMSYNDGWPDGPEGTSDSTAYGYQGTLMALDVAELQIKYGANTSYNTGDDTYLMPDVNAPGTMYACIWDAGGADTIQAQGRANSTIDLRTATLQYEEGGGGFVSHTNGIYGGFTIANGVVIEDAIGARGKDTLIGNDAANHLAGGKDRDAIDGGADDDTITGGRSVDHVTGGDGADIFVFGNRDVGDNFHHTDVIVDLADEDVIDLSGIDADSATTGNQAFALVDQFHNVAGELTLRFHAGTTRILMDVDGDGMADHVIKALGHHESYDNFVL